ncbi:hypothetical protein [Streptomyces pseudovenezuelae]|uniref:Phytase-like domain-containing protein n=2 Tax=Streptomyces TaxID=1883 RepID=A0A101N099_9ACTN|nr:hypothetical protein [Streptomyces pseudovenezuelae]KUM84146.1 hypothetical protein AQI94_33005 [Streptomyces pseudovenezuelae]
MGQSDAGDGHSAFCLVPTDTPGGTADARRITLRGTMDAADGLQLVGRTLNVADPKGVVKIDLSRSLTHSRVLGTTAVPGAAWSSAAKSFGCRLYVVDANFGKNNSNVGNPAAAFKAVAIPLAKGPDVVLYRAGAAGRGCAGTCRCPRGPASSAGRTRVHFWLAALPQSQIWTLVPSAVGRR